MSFDPIPALPALPAAGAKGDDFNNPAIAFLLALYPWTDAVNTLAGQFADFVNSALTGSSADSVAIGTGSKHFPNASPGCAWVPGMALRLASAASPSVNFMDGDVTAYDPDTGDLTLNVSAVGGSGTHSDWAIGLRAEFNATMTTVLTLIAAATGQESLIIPPGAAPTSPSAGSLWTTSTGLFGRFGSANLLIASNAAAQEIPVPAGAMTPRVTNGPSRGSVETATAKIMKETLDFDKDTSEGAQIRFAMPKRWNEGTVTAQFLWSANVNGQAVWGCRAVALSDGDSIDGASFGTAQTVTDSCTANYMAKSAKTSAITIGGTPAEGDIVVFEFYRDAANGSDTLNGDALLYGVILTLTTDAGDDS